MVQQVRLTAGAAPVPHRWRQRPDGSVVVTLLAPPPPEQLLELEAALPRPRTRPRLPLPAISIPGTSRVGDELRIYRQSEVAVQLQAAGGWERLADTAIGQQAELGRLVAALRRGGGGTSAGSVGTGPVVTVSQNLPELSNRFALRVVENKGQWFAEADLELQVKGGVLDVLQLEVPAEWTGPFSITPAVEHRVIALPGSAASHLLITPQQAVSGDYRLTIRGPVKSRSSEPIRAPEIVVLDSQAEERIVVLANGNKSPGPLWETRGLQAALSSELRLPEGWAVPDQEYYRVVANSYEAAVLSPAAAPAQARVTWAEFSLQPQGSGRLVGRALFFVQPPASGELVLEISEGTRLVQVLLDGSHNQCRPDGLRQWRIATNTRGVPTCLEVIFEGAWPRAKAGDDSLRLTAPRLKGIPVARTLWSLADWHADDRAHGNPLLRSIGAPEAAVVRAEALAAELTHLVDLRTEQLPPTVLADVFFHWQQAYRAAHRQADDLIGQPRGRSAELSARLGRAEQAATGALQRMKAAGILVPLAPEPPAVGDYSSPPPGEAAQRTILIGDGWHGQIAIRTRTDGRPRDDRWLSAALVASLLGGGWLLLRFGRVRDLAAAQAPAIVGVLGLAWWLLAPLPWLGWGGVGLGIWLALRSPRLRRESSSFSRSMG
jgi:hypothetical protein